MRLVLVDGHRFMKGHKFWRLYLKWEWLHCWRDY